MLDKHTNYFALPLAGIGASAPATAGILYREVQGGRAAAALSARVSAMS